MQLSSVHLPALHYALSVTTAAGYQDWSHFSYIHFFFVNQFVVTEDIIFLHGLIKIVQLIHKPSAYCNSLEISRD
jgi:hypothetical protein